MLASSMETSQLAARWRRSRTYFVGMSLAAALAWGWVAASQIVEPSSALRKEPVGLNGELELARARAQRCHREAEEAKARSLAARFDLDQFLAAHFREHELAANAASGDAGAEVSLDEPPKLVLNPAYAAIEQRLTELARVRDDLGTRLTPEHPEVQDVEMRLAELTERRQSVAEFVLPSEAGPTQSPQDLPDPDNNNFQAATAQPSKPTDDELAREALKAADYAQIRRAAFEAQRLEQDALSAERASIIEELAAAEALGKRSARAMRSAPAARSPLLAWSLVGLLGLAVAALALFVSGSADATFHSIEQVRASLRAPILAVIESAVLKPADSSPPAKLTLASELALAGSLLVLFCA